MTIKALRESRGLSQSQLAKATGISVRTLQSYEQGQRDIYKMQLQTASRIAQALGVEIEKLLETE